MKKSLKLTVLATAIAAVMPFQAHAAGLGGINVFSALGQPLRAEIELHATPEELDGMSAAVPSPEAFKRANLDYSPLMSDLELKVERRGSRSVIRLSSSRVINEPFMDVLVELRWAAGSLLREYTFLLDPVDMRPAARTAAASARPATSGARSAVTADSMHVVRRGETLHRIALDYLPPNAQLEQMLIALLRENPDAFAGGNINRLRAGEALRIPDEISVAAVSAEDARREVQAQTAEFEAYRNRVAAAVSARAPAREQDASRESAGRVAPRVQEIVRDKAPTDQVQVSGTRSPAAEGASGPVSMDRSDRAAGVPEEDLVVLRREMEEMRSRLAELEQTVADQQGIIDIRDSVIAQLKGGEEVPATEGAPAASGDTSAAAPEAAAVPAPAVEPAPAAPPPAPAVVAPPPPPPQMPEPGMMERLTANPLLLAGGTLVIGLLALLGLRAARRRREAQEFDSLAPQVVEAPEEPMSVVSQPGGESVDTDSNTSVMDTDFSQTGLSAIDADEGVDPVAEADVYLAYGRDAQAEEILLDALKVDASRHAIYLKLLEVYVQRGDRRQFEVIATDLYSRTGGEGGDWQKAAAMGRKLDPENPLYAESSGEAGGVAAPALAAGAAMAAAPEASARRLEDTYIGLDQSELDLPDLGGDAASDMPPVAEAAPESPEMPADDQSVALDFDFDALDKTDVGNTLEQGEEAATPDDDNALSFDLDIGDEPAPVSAEPEVELVPEKVPEPIAEEPIEEEETVMDLEKTEFDANLLDFDLDLSPPPAVKPAEAEGLDLTAIDLDLELPAAEPEVSAPSDEAVVAEPTAEVDADEPAAVPQFDAEDVQREMETKLELARAYDEMGDREGARELLEEVVKDGSEEQREEAQRMLERLA